MNKRFYGLVASLSVLMLRCTTPQAPELIELEKVNTVSIGQSQSVLNLSIRCYNPNRYTLLFKSADIDISVDNHYLGHTTLDSLIRIPALDTFAVPVSVQLDMKNVIGNALSLALKDSVMLKLEGNIKAGRSGLFLNRKLHYEGMQSTRAFIK